MSGFVLSKDLKLVFICLVFVVVLFLFNGNIVGQSVFVLSQLQEQLSLSDSDSIGIASGLTDSIELYESNTSSLLEFFPLVLIGFIFIGFIAFALINLIKY
jgi:Na+-transporting NADH:ubiquinone oxidoreductase subunit NqrC